MCPKGSLFNHQVSFERTSLEKSRESAFKAAIYLGWVRGGGTHTFNPSMLEAETGQSLASLVYRVSSKSSRAAQRNPASKSQATTTKSENLFSSSCS